MRVDITFESLRDKLEALRPPTRAGDRSIFWVLSRLLGLAKTSDGAIEIFLAGPKLDPRTALVSRHLQYARWKIEGSTDQIDASRIVLPAAPHFVAIATLAAVEMVRAGIETRPLQDAFDEVEPIIEMALRRTGLSEEHIVGLIGELLCLEVMLSAIEQQPERRSHILTMWRGHEVGQRDFVIGNAAIEVKTTRQESSIHKISGLHQVELDATQSNVEQDLFLLSAGLAPSEHEGQSLPDLVERILLLLGDQQPQVATLSPVQNRFLEEVARYGTVSAIGYDHNTMASWNLYQTRFRITFTPRLYDLLDEEIRILHRADLVGTHVSSNDIQFQIELPPIINGVNPVANWRHGIVDLVRNSLT